MELTAEQAYKGIIDGAKYEKGDPVFDWVHDYRAGNPRRFMAYAKLKDLDQYIYDFKIWNLSKHVLKAMPLDDGDELDEENMDENGEPINWTLFNFYDKLLKHYYMWGPTKTRIELLIDKVNNNKKDLIDELYEHDITYKIFWYESSVALLKEWIKNSGITTKLLLIEQLPLHAEIIAEIIDLKIY